MELTPELLIDIRKFAKSGLGVGFMHKGHETKVDLVDLLDHINQQQAEIERLRAELEVMRDRMSSGTGWAGVESQQQPEPPQESLTVDILRALNKRPFLNSDELSDSLGVARKSIVLQLRKIHDHASIYALIAFSNFWDGYELTHAGRDYLASLDKPTIETTEDYLSQLD